MTRRTEGLYGKFEVRRTDGTDAPGGKHDGCTYFVLDLQHDKHMPAALRAYATSCDKEYPVLASQLRIVADDFGSRAEFAGIMAQKPALDLERQRLRAGADDRAPARHVEDRANDEQLAAVYRFVLRKMYGGATSVMNVETSKTLFTFEDVTRWLAAMEQSE